ncbi:MAG TPA: metallophosphoesterase family protein [Clostridiales bacterium]|jgi:predicted phosphodiesterase|nr:metallophosphoesterase family protein [Clostridiales bacterium]
MKKILSTLLALTLLALSLVPAFGVSAAQEPVQLKFNEDGKFKIVVFSDTQDDAFPNRAMLVMIERALREVRPDLVIFNGDNVSQDVTFLNRAAIRQLIEPVKRLGIPYSYVYGNHDAERNVPKDVQLKHYKENGKCLTYNADSSIHGYGNCNHTILSSDGSDIAFNIWMIDSNMYHELGGYDIVYPDQVQWYKRTSEALERQAGHKVPSLAFQHIIAPEIFDYLEPAPAGTDLPTKYHAGRDGRFLLQFRADAPVEPGYLLQEFPCPPNYNTDEVEVMAERGDVLGIISGHDHTNIFTVHMENGIDLIQTPGMSYQSYGADNARGFRVFTLDENNPWEYETETFTYYDLMTQDEIVEPVGDALQSILSFKVIWEVLVQSIREVFEFLK